MAKADTLQLIRYQSVLYTFKSTEQIGTYVIIVKAEGDRTHTKISYSSELCDKDLNTLPVEENFASNCTRNFLTYYEETDSLNHT
jgi:hypothetical protein